MLYNHRAIHNSQYAVCILWQFPPFTQNISTSKAIFKKKNIYFAPQPMNEANISKDILLVNTPKMHCRERERERENIKIN